MTPGQALRYELVSYADIARATKVSRKTVRNWVANLAFSDWPTIFPNAGSAIALIGRLIHHAEIIMIEGESYRRRAAELTRKAPRTKPTS